MRFGEARCVKVRAARHYRRINEVGRGTARSGEARSGEVRSGMAWMGMAHYQGLLINLDWSGWARRSEVRSGAVRCGAARRGEAIK